jgi:hypothetical protein
VRDVADEGFCGLALRIVEGFGGKAERRPASTIPSASFCRCIIGDERKARKLENAEAYIRIRDSRMGYSARLNTRVIRGGQSSKMR